MAMIDHPLQLSQPILSLQKIFTFCARLTVGAGAGAGLGQPKPAWPVLPLPLRLLGGPLPFVPWAAGLLTVAATTGASYQLFNSLDGVANPRADVLIKRFSSSLTKR
jgi:hypothetical protein